MPNNLDFNTVIAVAARSRQPQLILIPLDRQEMAFPARRIMTVFLAIPTCFWCVFAAVVV
jgi:hypothetical protein